MDASEFGLSMIYIVRAMPQREINDINAIDLANLVIALTSIDIFSHQLGSPEQHTLEVSIFIVVLNLYQNKLAFGVLGKHIDTVILVILILLIAFALKKTTDNDLLAQ